MSPGEYDESNHYSRSCGSYFGAGLLFDRGDHRAEKTFNIPGYSRVAYVAGAVIAMTLSASWLPESNNLLTLFPLASMT